MRRLGTCRARASAPPASRTFWVWVRESANGPTFDVQGPSAEDIAVILEPLGGDRLRSMLNELVLHNEESILDRFDGEWDDQVADEVLDWSISDVARTLTGLTLRAARRRLGPRTSLDIHLLTHPVNEALADQYGNGTLQRAYTRVRLAGGTIILDELEFERTPTSIASWLADHDTRGGSDTAIR